jgi:hypothetical protein
MQTPTAVRPSMANTGVAAATITIAAKLVTARQTVIRKVE